MKIALRAACAGDFIFARNLYFLTMLAQARRAGKKIGRPALRHFSPVELERIRALRMQGASVRKLASDFATTQWMIAKLVTPSNATKGATA